MKYLEFLAQSAASRLEFSNRNNHSIGNLCPFVSFIACIRLLSFPGTCCKSVKKTFPPFDGFFAILCLNWFGQHLLRFISTLEIPIYRLTVSFLTNYFSFCRFFKNLYSFFSSSSTSFLIGRGAESFSLFEKEVVHVFREYFLQNVTCYCRTW